MTTTLDDIAAMLKALIDESEAMRLTYEAHQNGPVAPMSDFTSPSIGNYDPRGWSGESFKGMTFSDATPEYLDEVAREATYKASVERAENKLYKGKPAYVYSLQRAGRARRWALRMRLGWKATPKPQEAPSALGGVGIQGGGLAASGFGGISTTTPSGIVGHTHVAAGEDDDSFNFGHGATDEEPL